MKTLFGLKDVDRIRTKVAIATPVSPSCCMAPKDDAGLGTVNRQTEMRHTLRGTVIPAIQLGLVHPFDVHDHSKRL